MVFMRELLRKSRSIRRFNENAKLSKSTLEELVALTRFCPSAANRQPLKYVISCTAKRNASIFPCLSWAGYLEDWDGPDKGERPAGYIIVLLDTEISKDPSVDHGIAAQSMLLGAAELGIGGCIIGSVDRERLRERFTIPERYEILLVLALGEPGEEIILENPLDSNIKYYRDKNNVHHVPKRGIAELILEL